MNQPAENQQIANLVQRFHDAFPMAAVPPYPPNFGLDPLGEHDEYAGFADRAWTDVEPRHLGSRDFDICAAIGFALQSPPHLWNYYVPAFLTASLFHDREHDVIDSILWQMRDHLPGLTPADPALPWWHGASHFANYSLAQSACVLAYLDFVRADSHTNCAPGCDRAWHYDWELQDELMLEAWKAKASVQ